jgi:hypothetical protein
MYRLVTTLSLAFFIAVEAGAAPPAKVYVILWFDTEDYILPASDDSALKLANWLHDQGIRATFKVVGEKARTLERRGRTDVIEALKNHEIGYHSNWHSTQPTPAMYLNNLDWDEGVAEFDRRERPGVTDVTRVFGQKPTCYGQPGSSWGPQSFGAMQKWGTNVYLDGGRHLGIDGAPHYYCGILTLYQLNHLIRTSLGGEKDLKPAEDRFLEARKQLLDSGGGMVSIIYHPCEFIHAKFWDGVNFAKGANPPREDWKVPPMKTEADQKIAYETFFSYISFIKRFPEVEFVTASDAAKIYRDEAHERSFDLVDIKSLAEHVRDGLTFQRIGDATLSASEILDLLDRYFLDDSTKAKSYGEKSTPLGPTGLAPQIPLNASTDLNQFKRTAVDVEDYIAKHGRVPTIVWLGSLSVTPEAYLDALARLVVLKSEGKPLPEKIELHATPLAAAKYVADDAPALWKWVIFPEGFRAPELMALAKRQAWTIKPAVNHGK